MKLSIITINLNNASGLRKTIESVISQSFTDFEFIVVDGASLDGSVNVINEFSEKITFWISEPDKGHFFAMNKGINKAKGEYCLFLNSGDFLLSDDVLQQVFNQSFSEDIVVGDCSVSQNGVNLFKSVPPEKITFNAFYERTIPHQSSFIRHDLFKKFGHYSEKYRYDADIEFFIKALIIHNCTYRHIAITISDYNLEGLSNNAKLNSVFKAEYDSILNDLIPHRIIPDYALWEKERKEMVILYWVKSKPLLYKPLVLIYGFVKYLVSIKKKIYNRKIKQADIELSNFIQQ